GFSFGPTARTPRKGEKSHVWHHRCVMFESKQLPADVDAVPPDGSNVRILLGLAAGGLAHFELPPGETSVAVHHRTVEEIWYFVSGRGEIWRRHGEHEATGNVGAGG